MINTTSFADKFGGKKYIDSAGQPKQFGYAQGGLWSFQPLLNKLMSLLGTPNNILDIGAGCGGFVATCNKNWIEALGLEFSQYALDNAILGGEKYLKHWDLAQTPWPVEQQYDWVTAIDIFEHLFTEDVDAVIKESKRVAKRWIIAKICTARQPHEIWHGKKAPYDQVIAQARAEGFDWLIVSGHVTCDTPQWWIDKFVDDDWKNRSDLAEKFKKDLNLPEDWRCTLILSNENWFENEFGKDK